MNDSYSEFFPRDKKPRLLEAYFYLILFGTFGFHQFYLGNKKRAWYLLITCGTSHVLFFSMPLLLDVLGNVNFKLALVAVCLGYLLGAPVLLWDLLSLYFQVHKKQGDVYLM